MLQYRSAEYLFMFSCFIQFAKHFMLAVRSWRWEVCGEQVGRGCGQEIREHWKTTLAPSSHFKEGEAGTLELSITECQTESPDRSSVSAVKKEKHMW